MLQKTSHFMRQANLINGEWVQADSGQTVDVNNPATGLKIGTVPKSGRVETRRAIEAADAAFKTWRKTTALERSKLLRKLHDAMMDNQDVLAELLTIEQGKSLFESKGEIGSAASYILWFAEEGRRTYGDVVPSPWADRRILVTKEPVGVIAAITPWNFPSSMLARKLGPALAAGCTAVVKPASQTPYSGLAWGALAEEVGFPKGVINILTGAAGEIGDEICANPLVKKITFTGSTEVAKLIEKQLAETAAPDAMLIAETGGLNAMIVDSTALPEQAVRDILASAFQSAGQRCSALRVLYVQKDVEKKMLEMLKGAMEALSLGDPWRISTDVGPVIDEEAQKSIRDYCTDMGLQGRLIAKLEAPKDGRFVAPHVFRVKGIEDIEREVFGPVLHVATFDADDIDGVIAAINRKGYGLTFGLHTRIEDRAQHFVDGIHAGNIYVNRNQIGAVVGSQPFGGEGLSGTGPKAGGPHYLRRFRKGPEAGTPILDGRKVTATELADNLPDPTLGGWSTRADRIAVLRKHLRGKGAAAIGAAAGIDFGQVDLPGPTGEANTLSLSPRGRVLCLGPDADTLLAQTIQALAAGNAVLAVAPDAPAALSSLTGKGLPLAAIDGRPDPVEARALRVDLVAFSGTPEAARIVRKVIADRAGPIVPLVSEVLNPAAYAHERAVCVDTTAAGGNASLLAAA
ncbi:MAG: aldehyde dehydrogenase family protein [Mesorhizobium sp.]|uniref:aldehyde dehydrogenase family protein n=3 Tax=Mesorhizobium sp. TaxID=1871066 RepID=UPI000FE58283|nr:MAG: aldehyde dehydrogenase family protein [Mesorhizobium sp.]